MLRFLRMISLPLGNLAAGRTGWNGGLVHWPKRRWSFRGRDARYRAPPAQIRTGGIPAYGSYLGSLTAKRTDIVRPSIRVPAPVTRVARFSARRVLC